MIKLIHCCFTVAPTKLPSHISIIHIYIHITIIIKNKIKRSFVQELLNGFIRYDPTTKRSLHKAHAIRQSDGAYFLHVSNRPPRGRWSDPKPETGAGTSSANNNNNSNNNSNNNNNNHSNNNKKKSSPKSKVA
jgi:hypothetical protein